MRRVPSTLRRKLLDMDASTRREWQRQLRKVGKRRAKALEKVDAATAEAVVLGDEARAAGLHKTEIAALLQISRPTLDAWLKD